MLTPEWVKRYQKNAEKVFLEPTRNKCTWRNQVGCPAQPALIHLRLYVCLLVRPSVRPSVMVYFTFVDSCRFNNICGVDKSHVELKSHVECYCIMYVTHQNCRLTLHSSSPHAVSISNSIQSSQRNSYFQSLIRWQCRWMRSWQAWWQVEPPNGPNNMPGVHYLAVFSQITMPLTDCGRLSHKGLCNNYNTRLGMQLRGCLVRNIPSCNCRTKDLWQMLHDCRMSKCAKNITKKGKAV